MLESQNIEWKQSWKEDYLKWVCGFANAQGGTIYVGIDDSDQTYSTTNRCFKAGYIDTWGRGIAVIKEACETAKLPEPEFSEINGGVQVTLKTTQQNLPFTPEVTPEVTGEVEAGAQSGAQSKAQSRTILAALVRGPLPANALTTALKLQSKTGAFKRVIKDLLEQALIEYTLPDKPNSRLQKYRLTPAGEQFLSEHEPA